MTTCPQCGEEFKQIGSHWVASSTCHHPKFTKRQKEIIYGLLMGDGYLANHSYTKNCYLEVKMINQPYLEYLDNVFGVLGGGVFIRETAEKAVKRCKKSGFASDAQVENYHDIYRWRVRSHPELNAFASWYQDEGKVWPLDIILSPVTLKHYFCGDGTRKTYKLSNGQEKSILGISMVNERKNKNKIEHIFQHSGLPIPNHWKENKKAENGSYRCGARWNVKNSYKLWNYMGQPLPGFREKWPSDFTN